MSSEPMDSSAPGVEITVSAPNSVSGTSAGVASVPMAAVLSMPSAPALLRPPMLGASPLLRAPAPSMRPTMARPSLVSRPGEFSLFDAHVSASMHAVSFPSVAGDAQRAAHASPFLELGPVDSPSFSISTFDANMADMSMDLARGHGVFDVAFSTQPANSNLFSALLPGPSGTAPMSLGTTSLSLGSLGDALPQLSRPPSVSPIPLASVPFTIGSPPIFPFSGPPPMPLPSMSATMGAIADIPSIVAALVTALGHKPEATLSGVGAFKPKPWAGNTTGYTQIVFLAAMENFFSLANVPPSKWVSMTLSNMSPDISLTIRNRGMCAGFPDVSTLPWPVFTKFLSTCNYQLDPQLTVRSRINQLTVSRGTVDVFVRKVKALRAELVNPQYAMSDLDFIFLLQKVISREYRALHENTKLNPSHQPWEDAEQYLLALSAWEQSVGIASNHASNPTPAPSHPRNKCDPRNARQQGHNPNGKRQRDSGNAQGGGNGTKPPAPFKGTPVYCRHCHKFGHKESECRNKAAGHPAKQGSPPTSPPQWYLDRYGGANKKQK